MKIVFSIAKAELYKLFYSPVAWLILVIFTLQLAIAFVNPNYGIGAFLHAQLTGYHNDDITNEFFSAPNAFFFRALSNIYYYIPLLTMGIMSREFSTGSIKLLYSSPITNRQIILGKYLSIMIFGLVLVAILGVFCGFAAAVFDHVDWRLLLCALLGIYLLICAYGAVGLFISCLTSYLVVAAIGTVAIFALLGYLSGLGQDIPVVRDITYWIGFSGRDTTFVLGLITSEDLLYFLIIIGVFLSFAVIKLQSGRQKLNWAVTWSRYSAVIIIAIVLGYISAQPRFKGFIDVTRTKRNTLTASSQKIMAALPYGTSITTYVNVLDYLYFYVTPDQYMRDKERFSQYLRFRPDLKLNYKYYYHRTINPALDKQYPKLNDRQRLDAQKHLYQWDFDILPYEKIAEEVDLRPENFRVVRVITTPEGKRSLLRFFDDSESLPREAEISASFKKLVANLPEVAFVEGQNERSLNDLTDNGYNRWSIDKLNRDALVNQGFKVRPVSLDYPLSKDINILVLADLAKPLNATQKANLEFYLNNGGNLLFLAEPGQQNSVNSLIERFGVSLLPGQLIHTTSRFSSSLLALQPEHNVGSVSYFFDDVVKFNWYLTMPTAGALKITANKGYTVTTLFQSNPSEIWKTLSLNISKSDSVKYNGLNGDSKNIYPTLVALEKKQNGRSQRIVIGSDADWLSNGELSSNRTHVSSANFRTQLAVFNFLSGNESPVDTRRANPLDNHISISEGAWIISKNIINWAYPLILALTGVFVWIRRRGR